MAIVSRLVIMVITFLMAANTGQASEDEFTATRYGSFIHFKTVPNALFFFDDIKKEDSFEFRKALRNHDVDTVVLASDGGLVFEGLQMAGIIYDRKLTTFVPKGFECLSACAFMFFAGDAKVSAGELGVHQFSKDEEGQKKEEPVGVTDFVSQYTVSEIIGFLNEFETPPFVFEKMFATKDMYYFSPEELKTIGKPKVDSEKPMTWVWDEDTKRLIPNLSENSNLQGIDKFLERLSKFLSEEECSEDSKECSSEQLCSRAAKDNNWITENDGREFVKEAKRRGLSCDVVEKTTTCISDPSMCSTSELCTEVTMLKNGVTAWRTDPAIQAYLTETRRRGLSCQVTDSIPMVGTLAIYTEKQNYRVGDSIRLIIEPQRDCRLTLINIDDDSDSCVMFPHPELADKPIAGGSRYIFPPKGSLRFSEAGVETVIAVCNFSRAAISAELRDTSKVSCDKTQLVNAEVRVQDSAILETFTFDISGSADALSDVANSTDAGSVGRSIVKAQISIPVSAK